MKALFLLFMIFNALACPEQFLTTTNVVHVPIDASSKNDMTEKRFFEIMKWFDSHYGPIIKNQYGAKLNMIGDWKESMAGAFAQREDDLWIIRVFGGVSRHPLITEDAFIFILCHEMGHHIGGAPKKKARFGKRDWASSEGQADYFATLKCTRRLFSEQDNITIINNMNYPKVLEEECNKIFDNKNGVALCIRSNMAGLSHAKFLNRKDEAHSPVSFDTPDRNIVTSTVHDHPSPQCRLDTTFHGALCPISWKVELDQENFETGACLKHDYPIGFRPSCWFNPEKP